nr:MAG TPA: AAA domain protein [Caudoviricetes sp.]
MSIFYMMVGLPASGKSTVANSLGGNVIVRSSDELRDKLLGDINDMSNNSGVFDILHSLVKSDLYCGKDVVYDATNIYPKYRKEFLQSLHLLNCKKVCIFMNIPFYDCWRRNSQRDRVVPFEAMDRMRERLIPPTMDEGWDEIFEVRYSFKEEV